MCPELTLLPAEQLVKTGEVDYANWSYEKGALRYILRRRYYMALELMRPRPHYSRILEIGYGSGIFLPELAKHADEVHGIDVHEHAGEVSAKLAAVGIQATLSTMPAENIPYGPNQFDCVLAMSALEFVSDINQVCREVRRVLKPDGIFVVITPAVSRMVDLGLYVLTGNSARKDFGDRREKVIPALKKHFHVNKSIAWPRLVRPLLYRGFCLTK